VVSLRTERGSQPATNPKFLERCDTKPQKAARCLQESSNKCTSADKATGDSAHSSGSTGGLRGAGAGANGRAVGIGANRVGAGASGLASRGSRLGDEEGGAVVGRHGEGGSAVVGVADGDGVDASSDGRDGHEQRLGGDLVWDARLNGGLAGLDGRLAGNGGLTCDHTARVGLGSEGGLGSWVDGRRLGCSLGSEWFMLDEMEFELTSDWAKTTAVKAEAMKREARILKVCGGLTGWLRKRGIVSNNDGLGYGLNDCGMEVNGWEGMQSCAETRRLLFGRPLVSRYHLQQASELLPLSAVCLLRHPGPATAPQPIIAWHLSGSCVWRSGALNFVSVRIEERFSVGVYCG
jgi:hypothetical protein